MRLVCVALALTVLHACSVDSEGGMVGLPTDGDGGDGSETQASDSGDGDDDTVNNTNNQGTSIADIVVDNSIKYAVAVAAVVRGCFLGNEFVTTSPVST